MPWQRTDCLLWEKMIVFHLMHPPPFVLVFYSLIFRPAQGRKPNAEPGSRNEKNKRILFQDGKLLASLRGSFTSYTQFLLHPRSSLHSPSIHLQNTSLPPTFPPSFLPQLMLLHSSYVIWNNSFQILSFFWMTLGSIASK